MAGPGDGGGGDDAGDALLAFLRRPALRRLWPLVRRRAERLGGVRGTVRLGDATDAERRALADLLALPTVPRGEVRVGLQELDRALRASRFGVGLETALERLGGPLRDRPAERAAEERRRRGTWRRAADHAAVADRPRLAEWLEGLRGVGLLRRLAGGDGEDDEPLLQGTLAVLAALPAAGAAPVRLPVLAGEVLGSSHALDAGRPEATLALHALAFLEGAALPGDAAARRALWQRHGVATDDLSTDVLALGLEPLGDGAVASALRLLAGAGEPARLTLRQIAGAGLRFPAALEVYVCENPSVVAAAADRLPAAPPLVCVAGFPNLAARGLLRALAGAGAVVRYHGDFDWSGVQIGNLVHGLLPRAHLFRPWRFAAADYRRAVCRGAAGPPLAGEPVAAAWDLDLAPAMTADGRVVEEEQVLDDLLADLHAAGDVR